MAKESILFLCTLNAVRSPMAEGLAKKTYSENYDFYSAGIQTSEVDYFSSEVMKEIDIDISKHLPKSILDFEGQNFQQIICLSQESSIYMDTLCQQHQSEGYFWDIPSPADFKLSSEKREDVLEQYRNIRTLLDTEIKNHFK